MKLRDLLRIEKAAIVCDILFKCEQRLIDDLRGEEINHITVLSRAEYRNSLCNIINTLRGIKDDKSNKIKRNSSDIHREGKAKEVKKTTKAPAPRNRKASLDFRRKRK